MLKVLLTSTILSVLTFTNEPKVFICDSENSVAYHLKKECRGLNACNEEIIEVTLEKAVGKELRLCGWED